MYLAVLLQGISTPGLRIRDKWLALRSPLTHGRLRLGGGGRRLVAVSPPRQSRDNGFRGRGPGGSIAVLKLGKCCRGPPGCAFGGSPARPPTPWPRVTDRAPGTLTRRPYNTGDDTSTRRGLGEKKRGGGGHLRTQTLCWSSVTVDKSTRSGCPLETPPRALVTRSRFNGAVLTAIVLVGLSRAVTRSCKPTHPTTYQTHPKTPKTDHLSPRTIFKKDITLGYITQKAPKKTHWNESRRVEITFSHGAGLTGVEKGMVQGRNMVATSREVNNTSPGASACVTIIIGAPSRRFSGGFAPGFSQVGIVPDDSSEPIRVKRGGYGAAPVRARNPADQRHRPARFPHAKIRVDPAGKQTRFALVDGEWSINFTTAAPLYALTAQQRRKHFTLVQSLSRSGDGRLDACDNVIIILLPLFRKKKRPNSCE
ncbi:hypothetical protein PR048_017726 [Dryococelus australis]|uniref:Uncharacterized protein n=1 Tax=Dryococelus australis TaxID=614101 RepID=A0ABQ9HAB7_9NEOP|nr:hypothetical protein PR048_017726 [Dryococelus australis]